MFASITASGVISDPKHNKVPTAKGEREVLNFNLYVKPKNKNNGFEPDENMVFSVSIWDEQARIYRPILQKGQMVTLHGNFEVRRFTTQLGEVVEQNRIEFASILGTGTTTEQRQILRDAKAKESAPQGKTAKA
jgi:single-stranded DNA-binding protein